MDHSDLIRQLTKPKARILGMTIELIFLKYFMVPKMFLKTFSNCDWEIRSIHAIPTDKYDYSMYHSIPGKIESSEFRLQRSSQAEKEKQRILSISIFNYQSIINQFNYQLSIFQLSI